MDYRRASDDELRAAGWDPRWIMLRDPTEGPYHVARADGPCAYCGAAD